MIRRAVAGVLAVGALGLGPVVASAGSQGACRAEDPTGLPPGVHVVPLAGQLVGGGAVAMGGGFDLEVRYRAEVRLGVDDRGEVDGASAAIQVDVTGAITGIPGVAGDVGGRGEGTLALARARDGRIELSGDLDGLGSLGFSGVFEEQIDAGGSQGETLTLRVTSGSCGQVVGDATSAVLDASARELRASGLDVEVDALEWAVGEAPSPEVEAIRADLAEAERLGTSGPDRRAATAKLRRALAGIKALPDAQQPCLFREWRDVVGRVLQRRIDAGIEALDGLTFTNADLGPLRGAVSSLLESEKQYALLGLDECSESERRPAFDAIARAVERALAKAIEDGRVVDVLELLRSHAYVGTVSPALAAEADAAIRAAVEEWSRTTSTNLARLARHADAVGDHDCAPSDQRAVRSAVAAATHLAIVGGEPPIDEILRQAEVLGCVG